MNDRLQLEQTILGACLLENAYPMVADLLNHRNFSKPDPGTSHFINHQTIFKVFEKFYPLRPIDMATVSHELAHVPGAAVYIAELSMKVSSAANLKYYGLCLLETCFRNTFIELLHKEFLSGRFETATMATLQEIIDEALDDNNDIFELIEKSHAYLTQVFADEALLTSIQDFKNRMNIRIQKAKSLAYVDCLVDNLTNLNRVPFDTKAKMAVSHLTDILKMIIATGKVTRDLANKIFDLKA